MRILVVNWLDRENPEAGGAELHLHEVFGRLARAGHRVVALTSGWGASEPAETELDGIRVVRVGSRYTFPLGVPRAARALIREERIDVLVEDLNKVPVFAPFWAPLPVVLLVHHLFGDTVFREARLPLALATWLLERPLGVFYRDVPTIAVSESTAADLEARGLDPRRIDVVHNGVDVTAFGPGTERTPYPSILYLGRLKRYKRLDRVLDALARVRQRGIDARFSIAGTGDAEGALRAQVRSLGLEDAVEFLGFVSEARKLELFQTAWVHVLMSEKEGWGLTNIEAAACATPTIAAESPGLRDAVRHGRTGLLVPGDDAEAIADALERVLADDRLRAELSQGALEFARGFDWQKTADRVSTILARELARAGP